MKRIAVVVGAFGVFAATVATASPPTASAPTVKPIPAVRPAQAVDPSKCASLVPDWQTKALATMQQTATSLPVASIDEGTDLADLRDTTNLTRDLVALYQTCAPRTAWEQSGQYVALMSSIKRQSPSGVLTDVQRQSVARLKATYEDRQSANLAAQTRPTEVWATSTDAAIDREIQCRATPQCLADRAKLRLDQATAPICNLLQQRASAVQDIALENSNPSGVRDLRVLHDAGETMQAVDAQLPALKSRYAALAHKPFAPAACQLLGHPQP